MKEKLQSIFNGKKLKSFSKRIFTKKKIVSAVVIIVLLAALKIGYFLAFKVEGTVLKVDTNSITVTNFLGTKTVNTGDYPIDSNSITVGQKIDITKNISGDVISIKSGNGRRGGEFNGSGGQSAKGGRFGQGQSGQGVQDGQGRPGKQGGFGRQGGQAGSPGQGSVDGTAGASVGK